MMERPSFSIVIPLKKPNEYLKECLEAIAELDYPREKIEIFVLPDEEWKGPEGVKVIATGPVGPGEKRDMVIGKARGDVLAFIDDDAYPKKDWLGNAAKYFGESEVAAIGGPGVTPPNDSDAQKASGAIYASLLGGGNYRYRYVPHGDARGIDDYPSCNLLVRREIFEKLGGFETGYWPGEDTKLCLGIKKMGRKMVYAPDVVVYHHRRKSLIGHLRQVWNYAVHRGFFAKRFPETSLRFSYMLPSLFVAGVLLGWLSFVNWYLFLLYGAVLAVYCMGLLLTALSTMNFGVAWRVAVGIPLTHFAYGIGFLRGLLAGELRR